MYEREEKRKTMDAWQLGQDGSICGNEVCPCVRTQSETCNPRPGRTGYYPHRYPGAESSQVESSHAEALSTWLRFTLGRKSPKEMQRARERNIKPTSITLCILSLSPAPHSLLFLSPSLSVCLCLPFALFKLINVAIINSSVVIIWQLSVGAPANESPGSSYQLGG